MPVTILHNPRCSKSRQTLALLQENGVEPEVREYLKDPLSETEINELLKKLGVAPIELVRTKEDEFTEAGLTRNASSQAIVTAIANYPKLMERPVVINDDNARIGRPPEQVLEII